MPVKNGDTVTVEYEGKLENGEIFDSSERHGKPLEFTVGAHHVVKGFEEAVIGMEAGQEKEVTLKPEDAYGEHNPQLKQALPRDSFPTDREPKPGMKAVIGTPDGRQFPVEILSVDDSSITVDLNHPLAGKTLIFKIKLVSIQESK